MVTAEAVVAEAAGTSNEVEGVDVDDGIGSIDETGGAGGVSV